MVPLQDITKKLLFFRIRDYLDNYCPSLLREIPLLSGCIQLANNSFNQNSCKIFSQTIESFQLYLDLKFS